MTTGAKKVAKKTSQTLEDVVIGVLVEMREFKERRTFLMSKITKLQTRLRHTRLDGAEKRVLVNELNDAKKMVKKVEIVRFEKFLDLIVKMRNIDSLKGAYTKRHFLSEVKTYLENKASK